MINEKRESRPNLNDLSKCTEIMIVPPYRQMPPISVDGPKATFAFMFQKLAMKTCRLKHHFDDRDGMLLVPLL